MGGFVNIEPSYFFPNSVVFPPKSERKGILISPMTDEQALVALASPKVETVVLYES